MSHLLLFELANPFGSFEFATNEYINDVACVTLETAGTEVGSKDFIAVGTTIDRGEDLAARGAVCHIIVTSHTSF